MRIRAKPEIQYPVFLPRGTPRRTMIDRQLFSTCSKPGPFNLRQRPRNSGQRRQYTAKSDETSDGSRSRTIHASRGFSHNEHWSTYRGHSPLAWRYAGGITPQDGQRGIPMGRKRRRRKRGHATNKTAAGPPTMTSIAKRGFFSASTCPIRLPASQVPAQNSPRRITRCGKVNEIDDEADFISCSCPRP